jgi:hypothetical protein
MPGPHNQLGFLRLLLYQLKRQFGAPADIYYESADTVDVTTGVRNVTKQKWKVRKAICLPTVTSAQQLLPAAIIAIWRQGGSGEVGDKVIVIDRRDLPKGFRLETHNYSVVIHHRRYEVLKVEEYEFQAAYLVTLKELAGARVYAQVEVSVSDDIDTDGEVTGGP